MTREEKARQCGQAANQQFFSEAREAVVSFRRPELDDSLVAFVKLNYRDQISSEEPSTELYLRLIRSAFLELLDHGTITEIHPLTVLGWNYIDEIRRATGIRVQSLHAPAPVLSADEQLRAQIQKDWNTLPGDKVRAKARNDKNYFRLLEEMLASENGIPAPGATTFHEIEGPAFGVPDRY
jgi:hypothetical protein